MLCGGAIIRRSGCSRKGKGCRKDDAVTGILRFPNPEQGMSSSAANRHILHDGAWAAQCHHFRGRNLLAGPVPIKSARRAESDGCPTGDYTASPRLRPLRWPHGGRSGHKNRKPRHFGTGGARGAEAAKGLPEGSLQEFSCGLDEEGSRGTHFARIVRQDNPRWWGQLAFLRGRSRKRIPSNTKSIATRLYSVIRSRGPGAKSSVKSRNGTA